MCIYNYFFFNFVVVAGIGTEWFIPGYKCRDGQCPGNTRCFQDCVETGFKRGGTCIGFYPGHVECCCYTK